MVYREASKSRHISALKLNTSHIRSLSRDLKHGIEKEQVLKLIRVLVDLSITIRPAQHTTPPESPLSSSFDILTGPIDEDTVSEAVKEQSEEPQNKGESNGSMKEGISDAFGEERSTVPVSDAVMRALVAVAEHLEDPMRVGCLVLLTEIRSWLISL